MTNVAMGHIDEKKEILFSQNLGAKPISTEKYDKKHEIMKLTKEKFFRNTKGQGGWNKPVEMTPARK